MKTATLRLIVLALIAGGFLALTWWGANHIASVRAPQPTEQAPNQLLTVSYQSPVTPAMREAIVRAGATIIDPLPPFGYLVSASTQARRALEQVSDLTITGTRIPQDKLTAPLRQHLAQADATERIPIKVRLASAANQALARQQIEQFGGQVTSAYNLYIDFTMAAGQVESWIAQAHPIIEAHWNRPTKLFNDYLRTQVGAQRIQVATPTSPNLLPLKGTGIIVGCADTGFDNGEWGQDKLHPDMRLAMMHAFGGPWQKNGWQIFPDRGPFSWSDPHGHGTHVMGTILGRGTLGPNPTTAPKGVAPAAQLIAQSLLDDGNQLSLPTDLAILFEQASLAGASIHSNSWGSIELIKGENYYDLSARQQDTYTWEHPEMLLLFAAGNDGKDVNYDNVIEPYSLSTTSTAKNAITVGACEVQNPTQSKTYTIFSRLEAGSLLKNDRVSHPYDGIHPGMAHFSSRGPIPGTSRIKPDLVAPGSWIRSIRSRKAQGSGDYVYNGGTSMATPAVAGMAALTCEYLRDYRAPPTPTSALMRALLVNGSYSLSPGQMGTGAQREIPAASPNGIEGFGAVKIDKALFPETTRLSFYDRLHLTTGETKRYTITTDTVAPLRVTLAWIDAPGKDLVNDLDLTLTHPDGTTVTYPNGKNTADRVNTIERLTLDQAPIGTYTLTVTGYNVPQDGPGNLAAVVIDGATADQSPAYQAPTTQTVTEEAPASTPAADKVTLTIAVDYSPTHTMTFSKDERLPTWPQPGTYTFKRGDTIQLQARTAKNYLTKDLNTVVTISPASYTIQQGETTSAKKPESDLTLTLDQDTTVTWFATKSSSSQTLITVTNNRTIYQAATETLVNQGELGREMIHSGSAYTTPDAPRLYWHNNALYRFWTWGIDTPDGVTTIPAPQAYRATTAPLTNNTTLHAIYSVIYEESQIDLSPWVTFYDLGIDETIDTDGDGTNDLLEALDDTDPRDPKSKPTPPTQTFTPLPQVLSTEPPWQLDLQTDDNLIAESYLLWKTPNDTDWTIQPLGNNFQPDLAVNFPQDKEITYKILTTDLLGSLYPDTAHSVTTPSYTTRYPRAAKVHIDLSSETIIPYYPVTLTIDNQSNSPITITSVEIKAYRIAQVKNLLFPTTSGFTRHTLNGQPVFIHPDNAPEEFPYLASTAADPTKHLLIRTHYASTTTKPRVATLYTKVNGQDSVLATHLSPFDRTDYIPITDETAIKFTCQREQELMIDCIDALSLASTDTKLATTPMLTEKQVPSKSKLVQTLTLHPGARNAHPDIYQITVTYTHNGQPHTEQCYLTVASNYGLQLYLAWASSDRRLRQLGAQRPFSKAASTVAFR